MDLMTVDAELRVPDATARLAQFHHDGPSDYVFNQDAWWIDLGLTPRPTNTRARYVDGWSPHRYVRVGTMMLVPAGHALQFRTDGGSMASIVCLIRPELVRKWTEDELDWTDRLLEANLDVASSALRAPLLRLADELRHPGLAGAAMAELLMGQVTIELARHCAALKDAPASGGLAAWRLRLIDERLAQVGPPPGLDELAGLCALSVRQLTRGFRASRGRPLGEHIACQRAELAKRRLVGDESLKEIAHALGFASHSSFTSAFRRATGVTPREFRLRVR
ncbi:helix-turn-helix transcriptional regulator [Phenylobacterium sp. LjRoot225]|uniref:helix-turn-helix transcriptional regulator n=1 Tax=Phenylobacterium sp. LjRoot225 TaxID=3342285 RepID=UPI003ECC66F5